MVSGSHLARGGLYLVLRQVVGTGLSLVAMFFVTGTIGAAAFGSFAAALAIVSLVQTVTLFGIPVSLLRRAVAPTRTDFDVAFTLTMLLGLIVLIGGLATSPLFDRITGLTGVTMIAASMFMATPVLFASAIPTAALERSLDFRRIAAIELAAQIGTVAVSISLAFMGFGTWAPLGGWWVGIGITTVLTLVGGPYRPRLRWDTGLARGMLGFGIRFSASAWVFQLRQLFNPLLVGPLLGAEAVGVFALTTRIVEALTFVKPIAWRMSLAAFAQIATAAGRIPPVVARGSGLQLMVMLPLLLGFSLFGPALVTLLLGRDWSGTQALFPAIAMGAVLNSMFTLQASALHMAGRSPAVVIYTATQLVILMLAGWLALPVFGLVGVACAELAGIAAYPILHRAMHHAYGPSRMHFVYLFGAAGAIALYWHTLGLVAWLPLAGIVVSPPFARFVREEWPNLVSRQREGKPVGMPVLAEEANGGQGRC